MIGTVTVHVIVAVISSWTLICIWPRIVTNQVKTIVSKYQNRRSESYVSKQQQTTIIGICIWRIPIMKIALGIVKYFALMIGE